MKLRNKITVVFLVALVMNCIMVFFGLTHVLDAISSMMMRKQAENLAHFLQLRILADNDSIANDFLLAKHVADEGRGFEVAKILLIGPDYIVRESYPDAENGLSYRDHEDIVNAFRQKTGETVEEKAVQNDGSEKLYIDVVYYFELSSGEPRVLEVKLDFARSIDLLEAQYARIETGAVISAVLLLVILLGVLLYLTGRTAIRPVIAVADAMEKVGEGNMEVSLPEHATDEFGILASRFNEMVRGLREKLQLYKYVSQETVQVVRETVRSGSSSHQIMKREVILFFSDIRGFTKYSESREPESIVSVLNRILSLQADVIVRFGGDIDKFVGDEVMAVFQSSSSALAAALEIQKQMRLNAAAVDNLSVGIGVHRGEVVQGDIGSENIRDFTVIGDPVNTAARLQSVAKGCEVIISESAKSDIVSGYSFEYVGQLRLKGKERAVRAYRVAVGVK